MKLNDKPMVVTDSAELTKLLTKLFKGRPGKGGKRVDCVIETGTYLGTGSTLMLARAAQGSGKLVDIFTIEGNRDYYGQATRNLADYPLIKVLHGLTLDRTTAETFIMNDDFLIRHEDFPDLYTDCNGDPRAFYLAEISHGVTTDDVTEDLLTKLIRNNKARNVLFVLDSCGGLGYLEFKTVVQEMGDRGFYLLLDDYIDHCKHYRSRLDIEKNADGRWKELYRNDRMGLVQRVKA